jgi:hypothetical protein
MALRSQRRSVGLRFAQRFSWEKLRLAEASKTKISKDPNVFCALFENRTLSVALEGWLKI